MRAGNYQRAGAGQSAFQFPQDHLRTIADIGEQKHLQTPTGLTMLCCARPPCGQIHFVTNKLRVARRRYADFRDTGPEWRFGGGGGRGGGGGGAMERVSE